MVLRVELSELVSRTVEEGFAMKNGKEGIYTTLGTLENKCSARETA
jgi:hypothetical protein